MATANGRPKLPADVLRKYRASGAAPSGRVALDAVAGLARPEASRSIGAMVLEMNEDYQVTFGRLVLEANIKSVAVTVTAEGGDERAQKLADDLTALWKRTVSIMCDAIAYGRVAFEKYFKFDPESFLTCVHLDDLPFEITEMRLRDGRFDGIDISGKTKVFLDVSESWWLALNPTAMQPHGKSRYKGAARKAYLDRKETKRLRALFLQKFAIGWAKAHVQSQYKNPETDEIEDGHLRMQQAYDAMRAAGLITFDNARAKKADGSDGEYLDDIEDLPVATTSAPLDESLDGLDVEQLRAMGVPEKTVTEGEAVGSFAMVSMQMRVLLSVVDDILGQMVSSFQEYVVDKAAELNDVGGAVLTASYPPLVEGPTSLLVDIAKSIVTGVPNAIVMSGGIDVPEILKRAGIPTTKDFAAMWADPERRKAMIPAPVAPVPAASPFGLSLENLGALRRYLAVDPVPGPTLDTRSLPDADTSFLASVPNRRTLIEDALDGLNDLFSEARAALADRNVEKFLAIRERMRGLRGQLAVAGHVLGMLSPWRPRLASPPSGHAAGRGITLANSLEDGFDWPWLRSAVHFLNSKQLLSDEDFSLLDKDERAKALSIEGVDDRDILEDVQSALVQSLKAGEALPKFRNRIEEIIALPKSQTETLFRTQTKQAFVAGQERALSNPIVAEAFPYIEYLATDDTRVRDSHWELDGKIVRRGTPEHQLMLRAFSDYNCRCSPRPVSEKEAIERGISSMSDLGSTALAQYQNP